MLLNRSDSLLLGLPTEPGCPVTIADTYSGTKGGSHLLSALKLYAKSIMVESAVRLTPAERDRVEEAVRRHCAVRGWKLWEVNARTTHVHVVVTAVDCAGEAVRNQLKAWSTRELRKHDTRRRQWWAEGGSARCLNDEESLERAILYTRDAQDLPRQ